MMMTRVEPIEMLLAEDNPGDVRLIREALKLNKIYNTLHVVQDGVEALAFLRREEPFVDAPRPALILLDINMPRMNGLELLEVIKHDDDLKTIPVVMLTTSDAERDVLASYRNHANCYITKPVDMRQFTKIVRELEEFWLTIVRLPGADG